MHQPHRCRNQDETTNGPHADRPTLNQSGMQGLKQQRRPAGRRHHGAPSPPATISTDTMEDRNSTIIQLTNPQQHTTSNPRPPGERGLNRVRRREHAPLHVSPVAHASSSRLMPTENQPRWGLPGHRPPAPGPRKPEVDEEVQRGHPPRIICPKEGNVRPGLNTGYLSGQNPL